MYEDLKRIMKELLFNGARRDIKGRFEFTVNDAQEMRDVTPFELL